VPNLLVQKKKECNFGKKERGKVGKKNANNAKKKKEKAL